MTALSHRWLTGDAVTCLAELDAGSAQLACTSPPYYGQRVYGDDRANEIGWRTFDDYRQELRGVWRGLHRVLDTDATLWVVIGDSASQSGGAGGDHRKGGGKSWITAYPKRPDTGLPAGQRLMVPEHIAMDIQGCGFLVRSIIVWRKGQPKPEDMRHVRRPLVETERIILATKHTKHRWFPDRLIERTDVWTIRPGGNGARHFAPYPVEIPRRAILAASERGDTILDPFAGSGTTSIAAAQLGRSSIGIDLYGLIPEQLPQEES